MVAEVQGRYYQVGAEISRGEQALEHARQMRARQRQELEQLALGLQEAGAHRRRDAAQAAEFAATLADLEPGLEAARSAEQAAAAGLAAAESAMHDWQERWEQFNHALRSASSAGEAERARLEELDNQLRRLLAQRERASQEQAALAGADVAATLAELARSEDEMRTRLEAARQGMARGAGSLQEERSRERELAEASRAARRETQDAEGRIVSLEALQRAALGQGQGKVVDWLKSCGLESSPRLARQLSVDAGWERAVETVLGSYLEAVCVESIDDVAGTLHSLTGGTVTFFRRRTGPCRQRTGRRRPARARAGTGRPGRPVRGHHRHRLAGRGPERPAATAGRAVGRDARRHLDRPGLAAREPRPRRARGRDRAGAGTAPPARGPRAAAGARSRTRGGARGGARPGARDRGPAGRRTGAASRATAPPT